MRKRNLFNKGSTMCFAFLMVLVLLAPNNVLAVTTQTITLEKLQIATGFEMNDLARVTMALLTPVECVFRINAAAYVNTNLIKFTDNIIATMAKGFIGKAIAAYKPIPPATYFARNYTNIIAENTGAGYHPKIC